MQTHLRINSSRQLNFDKRNSRFPLGNVVVSFDSSPTYSQRTSISGYNDTLGSIGSLFTRCFCFLSKFWIRMWNWNRLYYISPNSESHLATNSSPLSSTPYDRVDWYHILTGYIFSSLYSCNLSWLNSTFPKPTTTSPFIQFHLHSVSSHLTPELPGSWITRLLKSILRTRILCFTVLEKLKLTVLYLSQTHNNFIFHPIPPSLSFVTPHTTPLGVSVPPLLHIPAYWIYYHAPALPQKHVWLNLRRRA